MKHLRFTSVLAAAAMAATISGGASAADPENTLFLDLEYGRVVIELRPDLAPVTVARIKELARQKFYDGTPFHRVIPGFMAQGGDPTGTGTSGSGKKLKAEFSAEKHVRGTVSMARAQSPDSADSQFFHLLRHRLAPRRPVHGLGQGHPGHGVRRQDQEGLGRRRHRQRS